MRITPLLVPFILALVCHAYGAAPEKPSMADFVRLQVVDGNLVCTTTSPPPDADVSSSRVYSGELHNVAGTVTVQNSSGRISIYVRRSEGEQIISDTLYMQAQRNQISHTVQVIKNDGGAASSSVIEQTIFALSSGPGANVSLRVIEDSKPVLTLSEPTFGQLWAKHPDDVAKYLKPLLLSMDLEGVFETSSGEALRVLAPLLKGLPDVKAQIEALLPKLDDDSSAVRTAAGDELDAIGPNAVPIINALDLKALPVQTRSTLKGFVERMKNSRADNRLENPDFLMLCLAVDDAQIPAIAKKQLEKVTGKPVDFDEKAALADRRAAVEKMRLAAMAKQIAP